MRNIGNILWHFPFLGILTALLTFLTGVMFIVTVVGMPIGFGLLQLSKFLMAPYSHEMLPLEEPVKRQGDLWNVFGLFVRILYFPFSLIISLLALIQIAALLITIAGIPLALVLVKSLRTFFNPVDKVCIRRDTMPG